MRMKNQRKTKNSIKKKYEIKIFIKLILYYKPKGKIGKTKTHKKNHKLISI